MDIGDITDPQLDQDFLALLEVRRKRNTAAKNESAILQLISLNETGNNNDDDLFSAADANMLKAAISKPRQSVDADQLRTLLLDAVTKNDVSAMKAACKKVAEAGLSLTDQVLRDPLNDATILHTALMENEWDVGKYLIKSNKDGKLLDDVFKVTVINSSSSKTCLHILAEKGDDKVAEILIRQFTSSNRLRTFLNAAVLTEIRGQRPRHMTSIHLASSEGNKDFVRLLLNSGVDVNCTNYENDTPALWAARGNHVEIVRLLMSRGAKLNLQNDEGSTPLYWAIRHGYSELVRLMVAGGRADVRQSRNLGLVIPIVLASALGHRDIVDVLLDNGADVEARLGNGTTALHAAAFEGNDDVIELLVTKGHALIDQTDTAGNTALLCAAKVGNVATMNLLVTHGASIDAQNKLGETIWHYAIRQDDDTLLKAIAGLYRKAKGTDRGMRNITFANGCHPLKLAVGIGRFEQVQCLIDVGVDAKSTDRNGNTFYHQAAREGKTEIVQAFIDQVDLTSVNNYGDTPLHLAAKFGNADVVKLLVNRSKLDIRNKLGMTPLHVAVDSEAAVPEVIRMLIDGIVNTHSRSLVDATESTGSTALHIAARRGRPDILAEMTSLNIAARNNDGETPLHLAARGGQPNSIETILQVFNRPGKGFNVDEQTKDIGQSALHICAARGDWQRVELLAIAGADLSLQDTNGNTPLHVVAEESGREPSMIEAFLQVIRTVVKCATRWWCTTNGRQVPTDESELFYAEMRDAVIHLTSEVCNGQGLNVVAMATTHGSVAIVQNILNTPNIYRFREGDTIFYDVTYLAPRTNRWTMSSIRLTPRWNPGFDRGQQSSREVGMLNAMSRGVLDRSVVDIGQPNTEKTQSCLELISSMADERVAARMLDVEPFQQLVRNKWYRYQFIYVLLMLVHIVYMSLFSVYVLPSSSDIIQIYNLSSTAAINSSCISFTDSPQIYGLFLIWPIVIVIFNIFQLISHITRYFVVNKIELSKLNLKDASSIINYRQLLTIPYRVCWKFFEHFEELSAILFGMLMVAWYVLYRCGTTSQAYAHVTALVLIVGWMFTLNYTKGFEGMHSFTIMLRYIVIVDFSRFLLMYVFVLIGFGLAFHILFQISQHLAAISVWITIFNVFNMILGLTTPLAQEFPQIYSSDGGNPPFVYCVYILYNFIASIILVSLLIAMLTETYSTVKFNEYSTWMVNSLQLVLRFERLLPLHGDLLSSLVHDAVFYDERDGRWMMSVPGSTPNNNNESAPTCELEAVHQTVKRLEAKIAGVQMAQDGLAQQIYTVSEAMRSAKSSVTGMTEVAKGAMVTRKPSALAFHGTVKMRERPTSAVMKASYRPAQQPLLTIIRDDET